MAARIHIPRRARPTARRWRRRSARRFVSRPGSRRPTLILRRPPGPGRGRAGQRLVQHVRARRTERARVLRQHDRSRRQDAARRVGRHLHGRRLVCESSRRPLSGARPGIAAGMGKGHPTTELPGPAPVGALDWQRFEDMRAHAYAPACYLLGRAVGAGRRQRLPRGIPRGDTGDGESGGGQHGRRRVAALVREHARRRPRPTCSRPSTTTCWTSSTGPAAPKRWTWRSASIGSARRAGARSRAWPGRGGRPGPPAAAPSPVDREQEEKLAALNAAQAEADRQERILESMQWTLTSLWWKEKWLERKQLLALQQEVVCEVVRAAAQQPPGGRGRLREARHGRVAPVPGEGADARKSGNAAPRWRRTRLRCPSANWS